MKILAITNCPTGIAHTYMAAEALEKAAKKLNVDIKVETQGSIGVENEFTPEEIAEAHCILIASGAAVDMSRFKGKTIVEWPVGTVINKAEEAIKAAMSAKRSDDGTVKSASSTRKAAPTNKGVLKHLFTGISYMIPFVAAGGLLIALSFLWGLEPAPGSFGEKLGQLGGVALGLMLPVMAGYIAYSIADRPGIAPGMIMGYIAMDIVEAGFLGAIVGGLLAGYIVFYLKKIKLPTALEGLKPVLIIPLITTFVGGLLMIYVIGTPISSLMNILTNWLQNINTLNAVILGLVMGLMTAFDMGGPFDKVAYTFSVGLLDAGIFAPMAANMAAGMTPALGLALATVLFKDKFTKDEVEAGKTAWFLGACFITEGAIPFAAADPFRILPATMIGAGVTGALSMLFGCTLRAPHGGIFAMLIPGTVGNILLYIVSILVGMVVTAFLAGFFKSLGREETVQESSEKKSSGYAV